MINTLPSLTPFSLAEAYLFMQLVELVDEWRGWDDVYLMILKVWLVLSWLAAF
jgi:hypothetical protein